VHHLYDQNIINFDFALLLLSTPFDFLDPKYQHVTAACLPTQAHDESLGASVSIYLYLFLRLYSNSLLNLLSF
jgi:hypothetical protein